ncbi:MAG: hypothetical protein ACYTGV_03240 [Planctomycetota bacterium]
MAGLSVYEGWAADLERDELFPELDEDRLFLGCMSIVDDGFGTVSDARQAAAGFLREVAAEERGLRDPLLRAADHYARVAEVLCDAFHKAPSQNDPPSERRRLCNPELRREMARRAREAAQIESAATDLMDQALAAI